MKKQHGLLHLLLSIKKIQKRKNRLLHWLLSVKKVKLLQWSSTVEKQIWIASCREDSQESIVMLIMVW